MNADSRELENAIGYVFRDPALLEQALTHPSFDPERNYERLEFLGDAVIELFVSTYLFSNYPETPEGLLTKKRAVIVCTKGLELIANRLRLGDYLILGRGEESTEGRHKPSILENTLEAVMGAVYTDGGWDEAKRVMRRLFSARCDDVMRSSVTATDSKSQLQEYIQGTIKRDIRYVVTRSEGPPHDPTFYVTLTVGGRRICGGVGSSKKEAEQDAASYAVEHLDELFAQ